MIWNYIPSTGICAGLYTSGDYVISCRPERFIVSYRPPGQHVHVGVGQTAVEAQAIAAQHNADSESGK